MSRIYTVPFSGTLTAAGTDSDWLSLQAATNKPTRLLGIMIGQISEVGDAQEEGLRLSILRLAATFTVGSGGTAITPAAMDSTDTVAFGGTARCNDTTVATTAGATTTLFEIGWNLRMAPWDWYPVDVRFAPIARAGEGLIVRCQTTLADDATAQFTFIIEEF